jgi:hypothetical protein
MMQERSDPQKADSYPGEHHCQRLHSAAPNTALEQHLTPCVLPDGVAEVYPRHFQSCYRFDSFESDDASHFTALTTPVIRWLHATHVRSEPDALNRLNRTGAAPRRNTTIADPAEQRRDQRPPSKLSERLHVANKWRSVSLLILASALHG